MDTLANQLRMEVLEYNKYGSKEAREKAIKAFQTVSCTAFEVAQNGESKLKFNEKLLPRECSKYFEYLCDREGLKFKEILERTPDFLTHYEVSWEWQQWTNAI